MKLLEKYWKVLLALIIVGIAVNMYFNDYVPAKAIHEQQMQQTEMFIAALESNIRKNMLYADVQDKLEAASKELDESRLEIYEHFPVDMKEEDQILYVLYLESIFGTEIQFNFGTVQPLIALKDGSTLKGLTLTVNYETSYQGFLEMLNYLSTDSRITSVQFATIEYDAANDVAKGTVTLLLYMIDSKLMEYLPPELTMPENGKDNIFN